MNSERTRVPNSEFGIQAGFVGEALSQFSIQAQAQDRVSIFGIIVGDAFYGAGEGIHKDKYTRRERDGAGIPVEFYTARRKYKNIFSRPKRLTSPHLSSLS